MNDMFLKTREAGEKMITYAKKQLMVTKVVGIIISVIGLIWGIGLAADGAEVGLIILIVAVVYGMITISFASIISILLTGFGCMVYNSAKDESYASNQGNVPVNNINTSGYNNGHD